MILTRPNKNRQKNNNLETSREFYSEIFCWFQAERKSENYLSHANSSVTIIAAAAVEHAKIWFEKKIEINALLMNIESEMRSHRIRVASCRTTRRSAGHLHGFFLLLKFRSVWKYNWNMNMLPCHGSVYAFHCVAGRKPILRHAQRPVTVIKQQTIK